ncbi:MAG TPA: DUF1573 domain-containing protein [Dinghuibacter sp.]|uniref:DUF1573 domain-containing protein n=1 Tax=Dinghuibacter sp. TaxID=2024697 RepID=UPI002CAC9402|nr:DUF1573 domain-containing protein [Dinghuibacter sp.]HTJ14462.1 DUF1573 domain-containing protein [Dinghuibacter sp.]
MQKVVFYSIVGLIAFSCFGCGQSGSAGNLVHDSTTVQILDSAYDFGKANEGEKVDFSFRFRNTGTHPLIITDARASCGCTKPTWPREPIPPGAMASIKAEFNTEGRMGPAYKVITVTSNANPSFPQLKLTGMVVKKN